MKKILSVFSLFYSLRFQMQTLIIYWKHVVVRIIKLEFFFQSAFFCVGHEVDAVLSDLFIRGLGDFTGLSQSVLIIVVDIVSGDGLVFVLFAVLLVRCHLGFFSDDVHRGDAIGGIFRIRI